MGITSVESLYYCILIHWNWEQNLFVLKIINDEYTILTLKMLISIWYYYVFYDSIPFIKCLLRINILRYNVAINIFISINYRTIILSYVKKRLDILSRSWGNLYSMHPWENTRLWYQMIHQIQTIYFWDRRQKMYFNEFHVQIREYWVVGYK